MRTFLVTGGAGFIGSHLCERLSRAGHRVVVIDDLSTGRRENVASLEHGTNFELVLGDVCDRDAVAPLVARADAIFHLAAAVGVRLILEHPVRTIETNVRGTEVVLDLAAQSRIPVLITSSSEVYGKSTRSQFHEEDDLVLGPTHIGRWSYACGKALDEFLTLAFVRERQLRAVVVRLFNTAGPRQTGRYGMVLPTFVRQALRGEPITVHGTGEQRRCFCHVNDVVGGLTQLIDEPAAGGRVFNIGSQEEVSIGDLARRVKTLSGSSSEIVCIPYGEAWDDQFEDMQRRVPDLTRVRELIGFDPQASLDDIIRELITHETSRGGRPR